MHNRVSENWGRIGVYRTDLRVIYKYRDMDREFYDIDVQTAQSAGDQDIEAVMQRAERLGFDGIVISDYVATEDDIVPVRNAVEQVDTDLDVRVGAKVRADSPGDLNDMVRMVRDQVDVVVVHGGDVAVNKAACGDTRVDVLAHPELDRKDSGLDHVAVKQAADNQVAIELNVRQLLESRGKVRSHIFKHMRRNIKLCDKFDAAMVTASGATSVHQLRAPRELASIPRILGMDLKQSFATVSTIPVQILDRADRVQEDSFVQPGVTTEPANAAADAEGDVQ